MNGHKTTIEKGWNGRYTAALRGDVWKVLGRLERVYGGSKYISPRCIVNGLSCEGWLMPSDYCDGKMSAKELLDLIIGITGEREALSYLPLFK